MKLISYQGPNSPNWGVLIGHKVVPCVDLALDFCGDLAIDVGSDHWASVPAALDKVDADEGGIDLASLTLLPVIPRPGKIVCLGVNYIDHAKEGGNSIGDYPAVFMRCATSLLAHQSPIRLPRVSDKLDFEAELAVIIDRKAYDVSEADALKHVFGYACFNDASLRDYQRLTTQWTIGKNFDGTGAFGPYLVTSDELPLGCEGLRIQSRLNGQVMQDANTADMAFNVRKTISLLSQSMTLEPGDVIAMGTPGGVGYARTPPVWMQAGDTIEIEIEGVGILSNPIAAT